jgi:hypothetical protein
MISGGAFGSYAVAHLVACSSEAAAARPAYSYVDTILHVAITKIKMGSPDAF